ncbi:hypothetical protein J6590_043037 [Homalodisca vitripennis]|nr:hypothetical protein J6590_043037 [Homalodisca vitripennis]
MRIKMYLRWYLGVLYAALSSLLPQQRHKCDSVWGVTLDRFQGHRPSCLPAAPWSLINYSGKTLPAAPRHAAKLL